ncbi:hypothetical protein [Alistipes provencensis]|uniref:hypothetical protein n=1 Tax=Alistipes provencensis TaxID=1816676 RepID=UPI0007ED1AEB|nr:hypothetical protein [Alistipes provencensis]
MLFKDCLCDRKQFYRERDFRLLPDTGYPPFSVRGLCQFVICGLGQIGIRQTRKTAEQKHIPRPILTLLLDFAIYQAVDILFGEVFDRRLFDNIIVIGGDFLCKRLIQFRKGDILDFKFWQTKKFKSRRNV